MKKQQRENKEVRESMQRVYHLIDSIQRDLKKKRKKVTERNRVEESIKGIIEEKSSQLDAVTLQRVRSHCVLSETNETKS